MIQTLEQFFSESSKSVDTFNNFALKYQLSGKAQADHICYKCNSSEVFENIRSMFEFQSEYVYQSIISKRRIAYIRFKKGIETALGTIHYLELSDQKPDGSQENGFDHIEVYPIEGSYEDMIKNFEESSEKVIKVERPHHTTHDIELEDGFVFRCTHGPLVEKIKSAEMV